MPGMVEAWELLTLRGLAAVGVQVKRNVLVEMHETIGRLLARSTGLKKR